MNKNNKYSAARKLLETQGDSPEKIEATISLMRAMDKPKRWEDVRSWITLIAVIIGLVLNILVAIFK